MRPWPQFVVASSIMVLALPAATILHDWPVARVWSSLVERAVTGQPGPWRAMRGGLAYVAIPALFLVLAALVITVWRRSHRAAMVLMGVAGLGNVLVQLLKHTGPVTVAPLESLLPISGHVGVVTGVALGWVVVAPIRRKRAAALVAATVMAGVSCGVVLAGWHTLPQVVLPLLAASAVAVAGTALAPRARDHASDTWRTRSGAVVMAVVGVVGSAAVLARVGLAGAASPATDSAPAIVLTILAVATITVTTVAVVVAAAADVGMPDGAGPRVPPEGRMPESSSVGARI